ncbi:proline iminopeptidase [Mycena latifolia]|nr:proline iminopeptidase [Mycena latifolia]
MATIPQEGTIPFTVSRETHQTWYKIFGPLGDRSVASLIALHGGPGMAHDYLTPLGDLAPHPVILYDQIGNARSTHLPDKPKEFWTIDLFIAELENLLVHFGVQDAFVLLGHSWGGILAAEFAVQRKPRGLKGIVLSNSLAAMALWGQSNMQIMTTFPSDKYHDALEEVYKLHACRMEEQLKDWTIVDRLHEISVPYLVINGKYDLAQDFVIPKVKWIRYENASHLPMWEERERYIQDVKKFLENN